MNQDGRYPFLANAPLGAKDYQLLRLRLPP